MSNPFGEDNSGEILEGFLCPICREDLKSVEFLTEHFERSHAEEQDALKSVFKDIFTKAKKKIRQNFDEFDISRNFDRSLNLSNNSNNAGKNGTSSTNELPTIKNARNAHTRMNVFNFMDHQEMGAERRLLDYFQSVRNPRLERYASETNKLIIRLHKLLKDMPIDPVLRKQHEQKVVVWLDGSSVKLCPGCAKSFHIARRQHHCRLCGSILCNECSKFLPLTTALELASLTMSQTEQMQHLKSNSAAKTKQSGVRMCEHCLWLLQSRQEMHESRTCAPVITEIYSEVQKLRKDVIPDIEMYLKIINSLYEGESIFTIADASALRGKIGQIAEAIDLRSKRILTLPCEPGGREEALKKKIRLSCIELIKEKMLSLPPLPEEEDIRKIQDRKRMEAEQRIETERRQAMEAYERFGLAPNSMDSSDLNTEANDGFVHVSDFNSLDNWSSQVSAANIVQSDDPLIEQINIIKGYIKQARQEMNFDVVETLEINLRELQREFYERQRSSITANSSPLKTSSSVASNLAAVASTPETTKKNILLDASKDIKSERSKEWSGPHVEMTKKLLSFAGGINNLTDKVKKPINGNSLHASEKTNSAVNTNPFDEDDSET